MQVVNLNTSVICKRKRLSSKAKNKGPNKIWVTKEFITLVVDALHRNQPNMNQTIDEWMSDTHKR